jgi:hypothetical protein
VSSQEPTITNFGLLIAYVLPGFTAIQGWPYVCRTGTEPNFALAGFEPSLVGFLNSTMEAIIVGLTVSAVRWLVLDSIHHRTGIPPPPWDFRLLDKGVAGFEFLIQIHYRYYKFYGNMVIALAWGYATNGIALGWRGIAYWLLGVLFFLGSRDSLRKYYCRAGQLLSTPKQHPNYFSN